MVSSKTGRSLDQKSIRQRRWRQPELHNNTRIRLNKIFSSWCAFKKHKFHKLIWSFVLFSRSSYLQYAFKNCLMMLENIKHETSGDVAAASIKRMKLLMSADAHNDFILCKLSPLFCRFTFLCWQFLLLLTLSWEKKDGNIVMRNLQSCRKFIWLSVDIIEFNHTEKKIR